MKNCLHTFTKWIFCLLAMAAINDLTAQNVRDGFCDYAIDASCGVAINNQTNKGGTNVIWDYQCNDYTFSGPERVYKFTTTSAGTVQIDLSIKEANIDLDILLLNDDCNTPTCLAQAITSNANGKTEQIIYNNAPAGTYYVIVDSETDVGNYDLLISCTPSSGCNLEYTATPNHISCGASKGSIDIAIAWGKAPFTIAWDNADNSIWNTYTTSDKNYKIDNLPAGVYTVKVTDAMGCELMKNNIALTNSGTTLAATFSTTPAPCGSNFGWINIDVANSSPPYWVTVTGPRTGTVQATSDNIVIKDMPPGNYEVTVEKGGCTKEGWVTVESTPDLDFVAEVTNASCGGKGSFWINVEGGNPIYTIEWWHKDGTSNWFQSSGNSFPINELKAGEYTVKITDKNGCSKTHKLVLGGGTLDFALESNPETCGSKGSVWVTITSGTKDFVVEWTGPTNGWKNTDKNSFAIDDLVAGNYEINIKDAKGCQNTKWITVNDGGGNLDFELEANSATCSEKGAIWVTVKNGTSKYTVEWWGPNTSKWATTALKSFQLKDLGAGDYTVKITDSKGCSNTKTIKINSTGNGLDVTLETLGVKCGALASLWIDIKNGQSKYGVDITGPGVNKWFEATSSKIQVTDLPVGTFTVTVTDANGCTGTKTIVIEDKGGNLDVALETTDASCGGKGSSWVTIKNGSPKFIVELWGPNNATFWAETNSASFRLSDLNPGDYTVKFTDKNGCSVTKTFKIGGGSSNMSMDLEVNNAGCEDNGRIWVTINGGTAGYKLTWAGPTSGEANMANNGYQINNLKAGNYTLTVKDHYGCTNSKTVTVYGAGNNLTLALESNPASCSQNGYLWADVKNGEGPYQVSWTGAATGSMNVNNAGFQVSDLPAGAYWVSVKDKNGCSVTKEVTVANAGSNLAVDLEVNNGSCGSNGYVWVTIQNGDGPYYIAWTGPKNGEVNSGSNGYQISDLPKGWYKVTVKDKHGCKIIKDIEVLGGGVYTVTTQQTNATCGKNGEVWVDMNGGVAPFTLNLTGPVIGNTSTNGYNYHFPSVPPGTYTLSLQDATGCVVSKELTITNSGGNLNASVETTNAVCNQGGAAWVTINGNTAPYTINWTGPVTGSYISSDPGYQIQNLSAGDYTISVKDNYGCYTNKSITISNTGNSLNLSLEATNASCGQKGAIWTTITGGKADYTISWTGPSVGSMQTSSTGNRIPDLGAGTYAVKVTDKNNCSTSSSITIGNNVQDFTISMESTNATCEQKGWAWITMNGGSPNYNISWSGPINGSISTTQSGYRLDNLVAGTYTVTVKEYSGCEDTKTIIIYDNGSDLVLNLEGTSATCDSKGSIWATISGGTAGYSYSWVETGSGSGTGSISTSQTSYKIDNLSAGTYTVTVRDSKGCETTKSITVGNNVQNFSISTESTNATCGQKGWAWITMNGGSSNYTISWSGPLTNSVSTSASGYRLDNLVPGTYAVTAKDANGCEDTKTIIIYDNGSDITLNLESTSATCDSKGSIWATISGGTAGYSYSWTGPSTGSISTTQTGYSITNLSAGTYTVTVRDSKGCETAQSVTVGNNVQNFSISTESTNATCGQKGWAWITMNGGSSNYTISWSGPLTNSVSTSASGYRLDNLVPGTYAVTVKDANGCEDTKTIIIYDNGSDITLNLESTSATCDSKGSIWATISGGTAGYSYSWTGPSTGSISTTQTGYSITNLSAGTYTVTVRDSKSCETTQSVTVGNNVQNFSISTESTNATCGEKGWAYITMNGGSSTYNITWSGPTSGSANASTTGYRLDNLIVGTYTVTVKDANGCEDTKTIIIYDNGSNITLNLEGTSATCDSKGSIWATISGGTAGYSYSWTGPSTSSVSTSQTGYRIENLSAGTYTVTVRDSKGCETAQSITIGNNVQNFSISAESTNATCGQKGWAWITMNGGSPSYTVSWSGALTGSANTSDSGYRLDNLVVGTYAITVKDANGCEDTKTISITDEGSDIALALEATNGSCDSKGSIWATISGGTAGYSYSWTGPVIGSVSTSETGYRIESLPAGDYTVTVRDSKGCETSHSVTVQSVGGNLTVNLSTTTSVACEHDGATYVSIGGGKAPYSISYVGPTTATVTANTNDYQLNLFPGDYTVFVKDSNGCEGSQKIKIYDNGSDLAINLTSTGATCTDKGMLQVNISGGISNYQINWSGNGINETITTENKSFALTDLTAGTYEVKVSDGIGCSVSKSVTINNAGGNLGLQLVPKNGTCGQAGSIDVSISGGAANYTIGWSGPTSGSEVSSASNYQISGLGIGNYAVTVKDENGCEISETVSINAGSAVDFNLTGTNAECNKNGNIVVDLIAGAPDYAISWTGPSSGSQNVSTNVYKIDGLIAGTYNITVKDANNCESTKSIVIGASGSSLGLTLTNTNASCGANGNITATVANGEGEYTFSWTGPVSGSEKSSASTYAIWDLPAGAYTVSVIDKNGCSISKIIDVNTVANELGLTVVGTNASCGQASSIQVTIANGLPNFKIEWSGANTGFFNTSANSYTITNVTNGETVVRVTDASGCSKAQAVVIAASPNDVNFTYQSKEASCDNKGAIWLTISDGTAPYNIAWTGLSSGASVSADEAVQITDLDAGVYSVTVSDKTNCMITQTIEVKNAGGGTVTNFAYKASAVTCNVPGSVLVTMISGVAPYTVAWSGPTNGSRTASTTDIKIEDLVVGDYQVTVASANGCGALTQSITIEDKRVVLGISGTVTNGVCGGKGTVGLSWSGDRDPYTISWTGTSVGSTVTNDRSQTITDLKDGSYTFTVTGFDGCTGQYQATINNAGNTANADFTYGISARKLTFSNLSSTGTYAWDFGDGQTSTETNPIHTYEKNGTYTICLTVTNDCGTKEKCQTVTINAVNSTDGASSAKIVLAEKSGPKGTVLQLPVRVENCGRISTISGTINLGNEQVAQINGLSPNAISPVYNDANHSFSYLAAGSGMDITGETILFYINVQLIGGVGESSTVDLSSLPVALELTCTEDGFSPPITPEVGSGRVSVATNASILTEVGGSVLTYWGDGVADAMVTIRSTDHEMNPMTTLDGDYAAEAVPMGYEYEFKPSKTTNPANGLSTFGLFLTQKYILGYQPEQIQSPYQVVAMDANCSGSLTTFDLFAMQQMLVGNLTEFPGCESWVFVDADHEFPTEFTNKNVFPYPNSHTMMLEEVDAVADFIGVKVGDVLGRALPNDNALFTPATDRNRKVMPLQVSAEKVAKGEILEVQFQAQDYTEMVSFQLGLDFDPAMLELVEFIPNAENELFSALSGTNRNHLKVSWYDPAGKGIALVENENLFTLKFVAKQKITGVMELFSINNRTFASELHQQSNEAYRFKLVNKSSANSTFKVHQNTPNPFMDATSITIEMPTALDVAIVLHDQFGRTIQTIQQPLKAGVNKVNINRNQLSAGIYYYTVKAGDFAATKRMMIIE